MLNLTVPSASEVFGCQNDGWKYLVRSEDQSGFSSQGKCTSYAAKGGTLVLTPLALCKQQLNEAGLSAPSDANYILGTRGDDEFQVTEAVDVICGFGGNDFVFSLSGGDIFFGGDGRDSVYRLQDGTFYGGDGNDFVADGGPDSRSTFNGGDGCDGRLFGPGSIDLGDQSTCPT